MPYTAGQKLRASQLYDLNDWVDYSGTFTWTASTTNPTKGNSTYSARYMQEGLHIVTVCILLTIGSTFTAGTGNYSWSLPIAAPAADAFGAVGGMWINDSGVSVRTGTVIAATTTTLQGYLITSVATPAASSVVASSSMTFNTNDSIRIWFEYEV